jgi:very-short-patch-repair endonuclease
MRPSLVPHSSATTLSNFLRDTEHPFTRAELVGAWSRVQLDRAVHDGSVTRIVPGVYCGEAQRLRPIVMGEALNLWAPRGLVSGALALNLFAPELPAPQIADLVVPHGQHMRAPAWVRLCQGGPFDAASVARDVRCVAPERAVLDAWSHARRPDRRDILYGALWQRVCTWRGLKRALERTPRVSGRRDLERVLGWFADGATSPLEVRARYAVFRSPRFADFEWQAVVRAGRRLIRADMLHRAAKVVIELDGAAYHSAPDALAADRARDVDLAAAGYVTVRLGWDDVVYRPRWCRERVLTIVDSRLRRPGST